MSPQKKFGSTVDVRNTLPVEKGSAPVSDVNANKHL